MTIKKLSFKIALYFFLLTSTFQSFALSLPPGQHANNHLHHQYMLNELQFKSSRSIKEIEEDPTIYSFLLYVVPPLIDKYQEFEPDVIDKGLLASRARKVEKVILSLVKVKSVYEIGDTFYGFHVETTIKDMATVMVSEVGDYIQVQKNQKYAIASIQKNAVWHLERISHSHFNRSREYRYSDHAGRDTDVYLFDSGIETNLPEFEGRAKNGVSFVDDGSEEDVEGHGTALAALISSKTFGVAKKANVISVKVIDKDGFTWSSTLLDGMNYVSNLVKYGSRNRPTSDTKPKKHDSRSPFAYGERKRKLVVNMAVQPVEDKKDEFIEKAIEELNVLGVPIVVSAGNSGKDSCSLSLVNSRFVLTVGSSDVNDKLSDFSSWGRCVNILAPGESTVTLNRRGKVIEETGTSASAALVTGIVALVLSENITSLHNVRHLYQYVVRALSIKDVLRGNLRGAGNFLAHNGADNISDIPIPTYHYNFDLPLCPWWYCWIDPNCRCI